MREGIHPQYKEITFTCACGAAHKTRSTATKSTIAICSECHPFFTGKQKFVDTAGRVEKFMKKYAKASEQEAEKVAKPAAKATKAAPKEAKAPAKEAKPAAKKPTK